MVALGRAVGVAGRHLDAADRSPDHAESGNLDRDPADRTMFHPPLSAKKGGAAGESAPGGAAGTGTSLQTEISAAQVGPRANPECRAGRLWPPLRRALDRTRRGIRIAPLRVHVVLGAAADPAEGARTYGLIQCGVWTFMPVLEQLLTVKDPQIHVGVDFQNEQTVAEGEAELSLRLGTGLRVAAGIAVPALRWFISMQRQAHRKKPETVKPAA